MLLSDIVFNGERDHPDKTALVFRDVPTTFGELAQAVRAMAERLTALGIQPGDRVSLLLPNGSPFVYGYYAISALGAVVVPVNPLLKPAELEFIWRDADVRAVLTVAPLLPSAEAARANLPNLRHVLDVGSEGAGVRGRGLEHPSDENDSQTLRSIRNSVSGPRPLTPAPSETDCAVILYTSGTTGHPKGAMLSHRNLTRNVEQVRAVLEFGPGDMFLTVLPLFHAFAQTVCLNCALGAGSTTVLQESFAPARAYEAMATYRVTILCAVPAIFNALLAIPPEGGRDLSSLRLFVSGGAPLPASTLERVEARFGIPVLEGDGPTECSPVTSVNPEHGPRKVGSVGPALPGVEIAIWDDNDKPCPTDEMGEIVVRGDNVMLGYLNQPKATAEAMRGGWYHTGDLGYMDEDGYVFIVDRKKDMIITSGLNVYPSEIERVLLTHPAVGDVAVIGQPDALRGEEVVAVVVRKPGEVGASVTERQIMTFCRENLANYKAPRRVIFRDSLPRSAKGVVVKRLLKKELELEPITDDSAKQTQPD